MTTAFSGGNASARARTRCHKFHFQSRRCRDKLTCLLPPSWSALTPSSNKSQSLEDMCHRTHVMSRNMRSLLRACVLFLNLRKEKGTATEADLGARSLGICSKEVEVSAARWVGRWVQRRQQQWEMQRNTNCCSANGMGSKLPCLTHSVTCRSLAN